MWKPVEAPGEWLIFLQRKDIKSLPIMEARKRYMQEQLLFEAYENNLNTVNTVNSTTSAPASAAAGGGGQRKFKYAAQYQLAFRGTGDGGEGAGRYDRVAISNLKKYWYDNFFNSADGGFTIPPPSIPYNIGSDYFFIKQNETNGETTAALITWGTLGRGRQKGQWTYSEYKTRPSLPPLGDCYADLDLYNKWNTFGFGSTNLSTPAGKWSINDVVGDGGKGGSCDLQRNPYELTEFKPGLLPEIVNFARQDGQSDTYNGNYSRNGVDDNGNPVWYKGSYKIYYNITCGGWKVDDIGNLLGSPCDHRIKANSVVAEGPLGNYTYFDQKGGSVTYIATEGAPPPPPPAGSLTVTGATIFDTVYAGNYIKDPNTGTGQAARYLREDNAMKMYYVSACGMWRIDVVSDGPTKIICEDWTGNPTGDSPLGTYQLSVVRSPETGTYTVTQN